VKSHRTGPKGLRGRWALAPILVAGCLIAPAAAARPAGHGPRAKDAARANVYVPPSPDTAHIAASPDPRTTAKITIPSLPDVVARYTGAPSAADRAYLQTIARASPAPAGDGASARTAIVLALASALAGGSGVLFVQRALLVERARRARRLGT
jgi:hypothetical protein